MNRIRLHPNYLIFSIQPEEGITVQVRAKIPGPTICTRSVRLEFDYNQFGDRQPTTGYEKLLVRLHGWRREFIPSFRHGGSGLGSGFTDSGGMEQ